MEKVYTQKLPKDDDSIWTLNCMELFLDPGAEGKTYFQFMISSDGQMCDLKADAVTKHVDIAWNSGAVLTSEPFEAGYLVTYLKVGLEVGGCGRSSQGTTQPIAAVSLEILVQVVVVNAVIGNPEGSSVVLASLVVVFGDEVILYGAVTAYTKDGKTTYETASKKAKIYSLNQATTDENGVGNASYPFNTAGAKAFIDLKVAAEAAAKAADAPAPVFPNVCVKGIINEVVYTYNADKGTCTFWMSDDGSAKDFEAYSLYYFDNKAWVEGNKQIAVGDEVIVKGQLTKYNTTYETSSKKAWLYSLNGATE